MLLSTVLCCTILFTQPEPAPEPAGDMTTASHCTGFLNQVIEAQGQTHRYALYVPREYDPAQAWPLIVFLHGSGERGDDGIIPTEVGIGTAIRRDAERFPALVLFPQCPKDRTWEVMYDAIEVMLARTRESYNIDPARLYLTGISMGGYGTFLWGAGKVDTFAALLPICGGGVPLDLIWLTKKMGDVEVFGGFEERVSQLAKIPIWIFHGAEDKTVPAARSRQMHELIQEAGGTVKYTEYEGVGHNAWDATYQDEQVIQWLLEQRKQLSTE